MFYPIPIQNWKERKESNSQTGMGQKYKKRKKLRYPKFNLCNNYVNLAKKQKVIVPIIYHVNTNSDQLTIICQFVGI